MTTCKDNYYPETDLRQEAFYFLFFNQKVFQNHSSVTDEVKLA